jgi:hypothetical protein
MLLLTISGLNFERESMHSKDSLGQHLLKYQHGYKIKANTGTAQKQRGITSFIERIVDIPKPCMAKYVFSLEL